MNNEKSNPELVSIIVPTHNSEKYIRKTIDSILNQTYQNFEIIIIDDCSRDGTVKAAKSIGDDRIIFLINEKQSGAALSRNRGIAESKGDYIAFLDGDDIWYKTKIEDQLSFMKDNDYDFSFTDYDEIDENDNSRGVVISGPKVLTHRSFLKTNYVGCLTVMYKKDIYPDLQIPETIYKRNDYALWLKLSEKTKCYHLNKVLASYRKTTNSLSSGKKRNLIKHHKEMFQKLYKFGAFKSTLFAWRNAVYYYYRRLKYVKKV